MVNDALHSTRDVGIICGQWADVAKDAADFVLLRKTLRCSKMRVIQGRHIFATR